MSDEDGKLEKKADEVKYHTVLDEAAAENTETGKPVYLQFALPVSILLAALIVSGTLFYTRGGGKGIPELAGANIGSQPNQPSQPDLKLNAGDHVLGSKNAKVTVIEYSDFQCPFCRRYWKDSLSQIKKEYIDTGKVRFVYRHYPLEFHPAAMISAKASECADESGKFWEMHDKIFQEQAKSGDGTITYTEDDIKKWAGEIGLNAVSFSACLDSDKYTKRINDDLASGTQAGVSGTPTVFINNQRIVGAQPYSIFKSAIDTLLR